MGVEKVTVMVDAGDARRNWYLRISPYGGTWSKAYDTPEKAWSEAVDLGLGTREYEAIPLRGCEVRFRLYEEPEMDVSFLNDRGFRWLKST